MPQCHTSPIIGKGYRYKNKYSIIRDGHIQHILQVFYIWAKTDLCFKVRADPDNTSLDSHLEGKADDPSELEQSLFTEASAALSRNRKVKGKKLEPNIHIAKL